MRTPRTNSEDPTRRGRGPSRLARASVWGLRVALVLLVGLVVVTQSGMLKWLVLPRIASAVGCDADAGRVSITPTGVLVIRNLRLTVPGIDSTAATFIEAPSVTIRPRWAGMLTGASPVEQVDARGAIIRLSVDQDLKLNLANLKSGGGAIPRVVPGVILQDAVLDFGEHGPGWYTPLISLPVSGRLARAGPASPRYTFELRESAPASGGRAVPKPVNVRGEFNLTQSTGLIRLDDIDLTRWQRSPVPTRVADLWGRLALRGNITRTVMSYTPKDGPVVAFALEGVSLVVPISPDTTDADHPPAAREAQLAMRGVSGDLRFTRIGLDAALRGIIESLPCEVVLKTEGYSRAAPMRCHIKADRFRVGESPRLLPFAPWVVRRNFERFSGPTAEVAGEVTLSRGEPMNGEPAPLDVRGLIEFTDGAAAFEVFPYPFTRMKGRVTFNTNEVRIERVTGVGPSGASLLAQGYIAPPMETGALQVDVTVADVPIDEHLRRSMSEDHGRLLDHLFCSASLEALRAMPVSWAPGRPDRDDLDSFQLGGVCTVSVAVRRDEGEDEDYRTQITVAMPRAGVVSSFAPYPVYADNLALRITDDDMTLTADRLTGLTGASGRLALRLAPGEGDDPDQFDCRVEASNMPCDELLLISLPDEPIGGQDRGLSPRRLARNLRPRGVFDGRLRVYSIPGGGTGFEAHLALAGLSAHLGGPGCLDIRDIAGDLLLSHEDAAILGLTGRIGDGRFTAEIVADGLDGAGRSAVATDVRFAGLGLDEEVEHLVEVVSPSDAAQIRRLRGRFAPAGACTGTLSLSAAGSAVEYRLRFDDVESASVELLGGRLGVESVSGVIEASPYAVAADAFDARLTFDGADCGRVQARGAWPLDERQGGSISIDLSSGRFESRLVRQVARRWTPRIASWLDSRNPSGEFNLSAIVGREAGQPLAFDAELVPAALSLFPNGTEVRFDRVSGTIRFGTSAGEIVGLRAATSGWSFEVDGRWAFDPTFHLDLSLALDADNLPDSLTALLPEQAAHAFSAAQLDVEGRLFLRDARLRASDDGSSLLFSGMLESGPASFVLGPLMRVESARAVLGASFPLDGGAPRILRAELDFPRFQVADLTLSQGRLLLTPAEGRAGAYDVSELSAHFHGGTLIGSAAILPDDHDGGRVDYALELRLAGADLAGLLADLDISVESREDESAAAGRGRVDALVALSGRSDDPGTRRGRGAARVSGGEVVELPGLVPLLRLSNLQPPIGEPLESASASFHLNGNRIEFDSMQVSSRSVMVEGEGTVDWPGGRVDMRFNSRGKGAIPFLDTVLRAVRNELVTTAVTGTVRKPEYHLEAFPATQRMLGSIFRGSRSTPARTQTSGKRDEETP